MLEVSCVCKTVASVTIDSSSMVAGALTGTVHGSGNAVAVLTTHSGIGTAISPMLVDPAAAVQLSPVESHESEEHADVEQRADGPPEAATGEGRCMGDIKAHTDVTNARMHTEVVNRSKPEIAAIIASMKEMLSREPKSDKSHRATDGKLSDALGSPKDHCAHPVKEEHAQTTTEHFIMSPEHPMTPLETVFGVHRWVAGTNPRAI